MLARLYLWELASRLRERLQYSGYVQSTIAPLQDGPCLTVHAGDDRVLQVRTTSSWGLTSRVTVFGSQPEVLAAFRDINATMADDVPFLCASAGRWHRRINNALHARERYEAEYALASTASPARHAEYCLTRAVTEHWPVDPDDVRMRYLYSCVGVDVGVRDEQPVLGLVIGDRYGGGILPYRPLHDALVIGPHAGTNTTFAGLAPAHFPAATQTGVPVRYADRLPSYPTLPPKQEHMTSALPGTQEALSSRSSSIERMRDLADLLVVRESSSPASSRTTSHRRTYTEDDEIYDALVLDEVYYALDEIFDDF